MLLSQVENLASLRRRFEAKVRRDDDGCWRWTACLNGKGYGKIGVKVDGQERTMQAQRVAYLLAHGELPDDRNICHSCDHPECVRPDHLFPGTQVQNLDDMTEKGRRRFRAHSGEANGRAKLSREQVAVIRQRLATGEVRAALAREFGVDWSTVARIGNGKRWKGTEADRSATTIFMRAEY